VRPGGLGAAGVEREQLGQGIADDRLCRGAILVQESDLAKDHHVVDGVVGALVEGSGLQASAEFDHGGPVQGGDQGGRRLGSDVDPERLGDLV